ncbi:MAG TPA: DUF835 domain-containing protein [Thermoplasmata archaeon]|jgi:hypothetical protein|nr:DUF835 domain-containing protein [Thermoplasmata archaeon]
METLVQIPAMGGILLIDERKPDLSYRLLEERSRRNKRVLCVTREPPERVSRRHPMEAAEHYWLITGDGKRSVDPFRLDRLRGLIRTFLAAGPEGAVLIDGIELLMIMNSYEQVRDFLLSLEAEFRESHADCVVPIDTRTLTTRELAELRKEFAMLRGDARG